MSIAPTRSQPCRPAACQSRPHTSTCRGRSARSRGRHLAEQGDRAVPSRRLGLRCRQAATNRRRPHRPDPGRFRPHRLRPARARRDVVGSAARSPAALMSSWARRSMRGRRRCQRAFGEAWAAGSRLTVDEAVDLVRRSRGARRRPAIGWGSLTPTELEVVRLVIDGLSNPQISSRLFMSRGTVKTHLSHVYAKLAVANRTELATIAATYLTKGGWQLPRGLIAAGAAPSPTSRPRPRP